MNNCLNDKVKKSIEVLKMFEPVDEPYYLCYSGGKDSDVIRILAELAGVKYEIHHNLTTMDAPESVNYVKSIPNIIIDKARYIDGTHKTIWNLIPNKLVPPTRLKRYCCSELKEIGGKGRLKITGVRADESKNRAENSGEIQIIGKPKTTQKYLKENNLSFKLNKKGGVVMNFDNSDNRRAVEHCYRTTSTMINPILSWEESDVWDFLHHYGCDSNPLYQCGFDRVGCIGCPLSSYDNMKREFRLYPIFKNNFINAFQKMINARIKKGLFIDDNWSSGEKVFDWWLNLDGDQLTFDGFDLLDV